MESTEVKKGNHGPNISRWRKWLDVKVEHLADQIGVSTETFIEYERQDILEQDILEKIAKELNIPVAAITELDDDTSISIVGNNFHNYSCALQYKCTVNPIEKITELYERLLNSEKEKVALLNEVIQDKK